MRTLEIPSSKKQANGKNTKHAGTKARFNFRSDPDLGVGWIACRRIPCFCKACIEQLNEPWVPGTERNKQPRYAQNKNYSKWDVFQGVNNWEVIEIK